MNQFHIIVIGGGGTGAAVTHDLTQRGLKATLVERGELTSGTTGLSNKEGPNHGNNTT